MLTVEIDDDKFYTTGQIAKMIRVTPRSVAVMCDNGTIKSQLWPPSFSFRKVLGSDLRQFIDEKMSASTKTIVPVDEATKDDQSGTLRDRLIQTVRDFLTEADFLYYDGATVLAARKLIAEIDGVKP